MAMSSSENVIQCMPFALHPAPPTPLICKRHQTHEVTAWLTCSCHLDALDCLAGTEEKETPILTIPVLMSMICRCTKQTTFDSCWSRRTSCVWFSLWLWAVTPMIPHISLQPGPTGSVYTQLTQRDCFFKVSNQTHTQHKSAFIFCGLH